MRYSYFLYHAVWICLVLGVLSCESNIDKPKSDERPNIIVIMADDMGYSDLGCFGSEISTPHIDDLAGNGLRYTQFYNTARCCPTRASLLTGLYPQQAGVGHMVNDRGTPAYRGDLSQNAVTIAEVLKTAGYNTYLSGKWHVTPWDPKATDEETKKHNWPVQRGFDDFYGMISGAGSHYDPRSLARKNEYVAPSDDFYFTDAVTDFAKEKIEENGDDDPFFLYMAYTAPHWPLHARPEDIAQYKGKYDKGWDQIRQERLKRMKDLGILSENTDLSIRDSLVPAWTEDIANREWELGNMETYAAMIHSMDAGIGEVVSLLEKRGQLENTLILFLQDNGACAEDLSWIGSSDHFENPQNVPDGYTLDQDDHQKYMIPKMTRDGVPLTVQNKSILAGPPHTYTAYGPNWAHASNTPFKRYKHWVHEGGIATPLIAHWPKGIEARNELRWQPSHLIDIMATCIDVAQTAYPEEYNGNSIIPLEGRSLTPTFSDGQLIREAIYWEHEGNRAVRMGQWKLVSKAAVNPFKWDRVGQLDLKDWELYDIEKDRAEQNDIAAQNMDQVKLMADMWYKWAERTGTVPRPL